MAMSQYRSLLIYYNSLFIVVTVAAFALLLSIPREWVAEGLPELLFISTLVVLGLFFLLAPFLAREFARRMTTTETSPFGALQGIYYDAKLYAALIPGIGRFFRPADTAADDASANRPIEPK